MEKPILNSTFEYAEKEVERLRKNNLELKLKVIELLKVIKNVRETLEKSKTI